MRMFLMRSFFLAGLALFFAAQQALCACDAPQAQMAGAVEMAPFVWSPIFSRKARYTSRSDGLAARGHSVTQAILPTLLLAFAES